MGRSEAVERIGLNVPAITAGFLEAEYHKVEVVQQTGSTNTDLLDAVRGGEVDADLVALLAEEQTAGRGRLGRSWGAPPRSQIIMSVAAEVTGVHGDLLGLLPLLAGLAVRAALVEVLGQPAGPVVGLKWPNDVLLGGLKVGGILVELAQHRPVAVIGIGVNYDLLPEELPVEHATSLCLQPAGAMPTRTEVTLAIARHLAAELQRWRALGGAPEVVLPRYRLACVSLGADVRAGDTVGRAEDVARNGGLVVRTAAGPVTVVSGEVVHQFGVLGRAGCADG
ncbi:biotin--[acetyl-CoA-carboxylase] ligase [Corynebacterium heidelbergense]|nr:biotin--[acetyl-CoA-carboxylase] ligase [Corynebacterium heidelbergense]